MTKNQENRTVDNVIVNQTDNAALKPAKANKSLWNSALIGRNFSITRVIYWVLVAVLAVVMVMGVVAGKTITYQADAEKFISVGFAYMYSGTLGPIIYGVIAVLVPLMMLNKEIDNTSLTISLVSNNSRRKVLVNKMLTIMFMWLIILAVQTIVGSVLGAADAPEGSIPMIINSNAELWIGSFVLAMITFFFAATFNNKGIVNGIPWAIMAISIIVPLIGLFSKSDTAEKVCQYISVFAFFQKDYVVENSALVAIGYCVGPVLIIGLGIGSVYAFQNRSLQL